MISFALGRDRQPTERTLFASPARLEVNGNVQLNAPDGEAEFRVFLRQRGRLDDVPIRLSTGSERPLPDWNPAVWLPAPPFAERTLNSSEPLRFSSLNIWLDGSQDLSIELEISIEFLVRGGASIDLKALSGEPAISLRLPQWNLLDVRDIL